jgi:hypothetical protein
LVLIFWKQTTTPTHEITNSKGEFFEGTEVVKKVVKTKKKEGLKHRPKMIKKANVEIGFRNKKIKAHKNEHHNLYEELKVMEEVLHQREEELCT